MPYLRYEDKARLDAHPFPEKPGELNYLITQLMLRYWMKSPRNYQALNDVVGAVESAKAEFQRRVVDIYEDKKLADNGDVYYGCI